MEAARLVAAERAREVAAREAERVAVASKAREAAKEAAATTAAAAEAAAWISARSRVASSRVVCVRRASVVVAVLPIVPGATQVNLGQASVFYNV